MTPQYMLRSRGRQRGSFSAPPIVDRNAGSPIEVAARARLEAVSRQHVLRGDIRPDLGEDGQSPGDPRLGREREMKRVIERQKLAEHFTAANDGDGSITDAKLRKRLVECGTGRIP